MFGNYGGKRLQPVVIHTQAKSIRKKHTGLNHFELLKLKLTKKKKKKIATFDCSAPRQQYYSISKKISNRTNSSYCVLSTSYRDIYVPFCTICIIYQLVNRLVKYIQ